VLLVGIVVLTAGIAGYAALDLSEPTNQPSADFGIDIDSDAESLTVDHRGGETIPIEELTVQIRDESGQEKRLNISNSSQLDSDRFSAGNSLVDTDTFENLEGDEATVTVVHEPSGTIVERQNLLLTDPDTDAGNLPGSGTATDPFVIKTPPDLEQIQYNKSEHFVVVRDIEGSITNRYNDGNGLAPIGSPGDPFTGTIDGNGHEIRNLDLLWSNSSQVGFFGVLGSGSEISDLKLSNTTVSGVEDVGSLAGQNNNGSIDNVAVVDQSVSGEQNVGGLVGTNNGTIESTTSRPRAILGSLDNIGGLVGINNGQLVSTVSGLSQSTGRSGEVIGRNNIGGSVGQNRGMIDDSTAGLRVGGTGDRISGLAGFGNGGLIGSSSASSDVFEAAGPAGGLVGESLNGVVEKSLANGSVTDGTVRGGLVGRSLGSEIRNSYAHTDIGGGASVAGGVVGFNDNAGLINNTYATGTISQASTVTGGVVGENTGTVESSYWDTQSTTRPARIPLREDFAGTEGDWTTVRDAQWGEPLGATTSSTLLLTDNKNGQVGLGLYDVPLQSRLGTVTEFDYYAGGGSGGDGLAFFLVDGEQVDSSSIRASSSSGSLGYTGGVPNAYLGIGFDTNGAFAGSAGSVGLRAGADNNYDLQTSTRPSQPIDGGWRTGRITTVPDADGMTVSVEMSWDNGNSWETVIDDYEYNETPPDTLKFGFSAGTGSATNFHAVNSVDVDYLSRTDTVGLETSQMQGVTAPNYMEGFEASVWQIVENPDDYPTLGSGQWDPSPVAAFDISPNPTTVDEVVEFDASGSSNADAYTWTFGDGTTATGETATHRYSSLGNYTVELSVTGEGQSNSTAQTIRIKNTMEGAGTKSNPYLIRDYHQLEQMDRQPDAHYRLAQDISPTLTAEWDPDRSFNPVGDSSQPFTGSFDGDGYEIRGLSIDSSGNEVGLFGRTGSSANIYNVSVTGATVSGTDYVGVLVGRNGGTISRSTVAGTVTGDTAVGGLVGMNTGLIENTYARGDVTGSGTAIGRLVGRNEGAGTVRDSFTTATVRGGSSTGNAVGNAGGSIQHVYWERQSGQPSPVDAGQIGLTTDQMTGQKAATYMAFDGSIWKTVTNDYPALGTGDWESTPRARFSFEPATPEIREEITFNASDSADVKYYEWEFGDGSTTGKQWSATATHDYDRAGTYTVKLTVHNADGTTDTIRNDVTVYGYPNASLTADQTLVTEGDQIQFDGRSSEPNHPDTEYDWAFDDESNITDGSDSERHTYETPGDYEAALTVRNGAGNESTATVSIEVLREPTAEIDASDTLITEGDSVSVTAGGGAKAPNSDETVSWTFGNGQTGSTPSESVTYQTPDTYTITLNVENRAGAVATDTHTVEVVPTPTASFSAPDQIKQGESFRVDASDSTHATSYQWQFGDRSGTKTGTRASHTYSDTGTYTIELTVDNKAGTKVSTTHEIDVIVPDPVARFTVSDSSVVRGDRVSFYASSSSYAEKYSWTFGDNRAAGISTSSSVSHTYSEAGSYIVTLTVENRLGVTDSTQTTITVDQMAGSGTRNDSYQITDYYDLEAIDQDTDAYYQLQNDITPRTTSGWNSNTEFDTIYTFSGMLDGNGKVIRAFNANGGLFDNIRRNGAVKDLSIWSADVSGGASTGILAGTNDGTLHDLDTHGEVEGGMSTGGIVGSNGGTIQDSYSFATVTSTHRNVGGLVGHVQRGGTVVYSRAFGDVEGHKLVGGLVGRNSGEIRRSWATGDVTGINDGDSMYAGPTHEGAKRIGGLVGEQNGYESAEGIIRNSYATGDVSGRIEVGGLVGTARDDSWTAYSYSTGSYYVSDKWGGRSVGLALRSPNGAGVYYLILPRTIDAALGGEAGGNDIAFAFEYQSLSKGVTAPNYLTQLDFENAWRTRAGNYPVPRRPSMNEPQ
jgi:PKD repeat protein